MIRDQPTGRYIDRDKLHYVDFEGRFFSVRGPSITPRLAAGPARRGRRCQQRPAHCAIAGSSRRLVFVDALDRRVGGSPRHDIRARAVAAGRDPDDVAVLATVDVVLERDRDTALATRERLDASGGPADASSALDFVGTPAESAALLDDVVPERSRRRLRRSARVLPHTLDRARRRGRAPTPARRGACSAAQYDGADPARPLRPRPDRRTATPEQRCRMSRKQIHLAAHFPGVNNTTVWSDPTSGSQTDFASFVHLAQTAERGQVRLLLPRRGAAPPRAPGPHLRSRRRRPARLAHRAGRARRRHRPDRPGGHVEHHVQRALRAGPPVRHARPPERRARRVERGDVTRRVHRRELPARRLPRPRRSLRPAPRSSSSRPGRCGTAGPTTPSWPTRAGVRRPTHRPFTTRQSSRSTGRSTCRGARRAIRC